MTGSRRTFVTDGQTDGLTDGPGYIGPKGGTHNLDKKCRGCSNLLKYEISAKTNDEFLRK